MRYILLFLLCIGVTAPGISQDNSREYPVDFAADWTWAELRSHVQDPVSQDYLARLQQDLEIQDAHFLFAQLARLDSLGQIRHLAQLEAIQSNRGGGFYGLVPPRFDDPSDLPDGSGLPGIVRIAAYLDSIRAENLAVIATPSVHYPLHFIHDPFPHVNRSDYPSTMTLTIDYSAINQILTYFKTPTPSMDEATSISSNPVFSTMLEHRRELGYIPPPLPDSLDLAYFIYTAGSRKPVEEIWKWLNPWNDFCLADLYLHKSQYGALLDTLRFHQQSLVDTVLTKIASVLPHQYTLHSRLGLAVNWGIRSWATDHGLGTNIVQFKDRYATLIRTVTHETFHRMQLQLCPGNGHTFESLTHRDFADSSDEQFYQTLAYIMLEGTATYVGGLKDTTHIHKRTSQGIALLDSVYLAVYKEQNLKAAESFLNQGLRSNGPFYLLGYVMSQTIAQSEGEKEVGELLSAGAPAFFNAYANIQQNAPNAVGQLQSRVVRRIKILARQ